MGTVDFMGEHMWILWETWRTMEKHGGFRPIYGENWCTIFFGKEEFALEHQHVIPWKQRKSSNFSRVEVAARDPNWLMISSGVKKQTALYLLGMIMIHELGLFGTFCS